MYASGTRIVTAMIGSISAGFALWTPSFRAIEAAILNAISFESTGWNEPSYSVALMSDSGIAGEDALCRRVADALLDAGEEALRDRATDHPLGEHDAAFRVGLQLQPDVPEHPVPAGLLLVSTVDLGRPADRLLVRDARRVGRDGRPELALEPLDDDRGVGLAHRAQDLFADGRTLKADGRFLFEHAGQGRAHLVEVALRDGLDRDHQRRHRELERWQRQRRRLGRQRVAGLGDRQLRDRPDLAGLQLADRFLFLAVQQQQLADPLVRALRRVPDMGLRVERAREDPQVRQPARRTDPRSS